MGFDPTPNGTAGARQPGAGRVMRWINRWAAGRIRKGAERSTPVNWFPGPDDSWLIVASAAGAPKNPAWYQITSASSLFAKYQKKTDRELPVIRLVRRTG